MKFRMWLPDGPLVCVDDVGFWCHDDPWRGMIAAFPLAYRAGFDIPEDTFYLADPLVSQYWGKVWYPRREIVGVNDTAILPLEVDA